eukprot:CAMPEP_0196208290 /NCGR_PEP_ID=MMETSP0912-20130531/8949_1 /TAXON_ID=49265 /ORGANISM="Thalassiosira rotula, Strain GSO102" /LENGTH=35 /DNA_ID= /DNA_START= /DNA_END= /DNA_ORIENTATION=
MGSKLRVQSKTISIDATPNNKRLALLDKPPELPSL